MARELINTPKALLDGVYDRLSDPTNGYNPIVEQLGDANGVTFGTDINFDAGSGNFFRARLSAEGVMKSGRHIFPQMTLFLEALRATNRIKSQTFFGEITVGVDVFLTDGRQQPPDEQEIVKATVSAALMTIFGDIDDRSWGDDEITFSNSYAANFEALRFDGHNWLDVIRFRATFECGPIPV